MMAQVADLVFRRWGGPGVEVTDMSFYIYIRVTFSSLDVIVCWAGLFRETDCDRSSL